MRTFIDVKSALIGGLVVALVACSIGAVSHAPSQACSRFEIVVEPQAAFVLDCCTGQVWSLQTLPEGVIRAVPHEDQEFYGPKIDTAVLSGDIRVLSL